jgi:hypothetical protein
MREGLLTREGRGMVTDDELKRDSMKQRKKAPLSRACGECLGKHRIGYDDDTEGLSHIWEPETKTYILCPRCGGTGAKS